MECARAGASIYIYIYICAFCLELVIFRSLVLRPKFLSNVLPQIAHVL